MRENPLYFPKRQRGAALIVGLILLTVITLVGVTAMQGTTLQEKMAGNLRDRNLSFQASEAALRNCEQLITANYDAQVQRLAGGETAIPPALPERDKLNPVDAAETTNPPRPAITTQMYPWTLDDDQTGTAATLFGGTRLDATPGNGRFWWAESARNQNWWDLAAANPNIWANALAEDTLDGLFSQPNCIIEAYAYAPADATQTADAFRRMQFADGITIKNENSFRRQRNYFRITSRGLGGSDTATTMLQSGVYKIYFTQIVQN